MIPRVLHRIWLDEPVPAEYDAYWERFRELHPDWQLVTWDDSSKLDWLRCRATYDQATTHAGRSDVLRYEILAAQGGVYVDTDVEPLRALDELLEDDRPFAAWEDDTVLCPTVMGASAGHPAVEALLLALPAWAARHRPSEPNKQTGPLFLTEVWRPRADVRRLPPSAFYPVGWWERDLLGNVEYPPESFAVHHWAKGWGQPHAAQPPARTTPPPRRPIVRAAIAEAPQPEPADPERVSLLVPFRAEEGDDTRTVAWEWIRERWALTFPGAELVVGTDEGTPFSKSTAVNDAFSRSTRDVLVLADADAWMDPEILLRAGGLALQTGRLVIPWRKVVRLKKQDSDPMLAGPADAEFNLTREVRQRAFASPSTRTAATVIVISRESFMAVEGMDPRFRGWGWEDVCFGVACAKLVGNARHMLQGDAVCLYHPRPVANGQRVWEGEAAGSAANRELNSFYRNARNRDEMAALCAQHPLGGVALPATSTRQERPGQRIRI